MFITECGDIVPKLAQGQAKLKCRPRFLTVKVSKGDLEDADESFLESKWDKVETSPPPCDPYPEGGTSWGTG